MTIQKALGNLSDPKYAAMTLDPVRLTSEEMAKGHQKIRSESGRELKISLSKGSVLEDGDILWADGAVVVAIKAAEEDVICISAGSKPDWAAAAYVLGNLHKPVRFSNDAVRTPYAPESASALNEAGIEYERKSERLLGRRIRAVGAK